MKHEYLLCSQMGPLSRKRDGANLREICDTAQLYYGVYFIISAT